MVVPSSIIAFSKARPGEQMVLWAKGSGSMNVYRDDEKKLLEELAKSDGGEWLTVTDISGNYTSWGGVFHLNAQHITALRDDISPGVLHVYLSNSGYFCTRDKAEQKAIMDALSPGEGQGSLEGEGLPSGHR